MSGPAFRNHHTCGFGVTGELSTGFPGYNSIIGLEPATVGKVLKDNGSATSWFGKNHNTPDFQYSTAGPFDQSPSCVGFEYFYGFMGGETVAAAIRRAYKPLCDQTPCVRSDAVLRSHFHCPSGP